MCGFTGIVYFDENRKVDQQTLKRMNDSLTHRGPDDEGFMVEGNIGLAFRRLSIIDLDTGHQPLCDPDKKAWIVFNGEIYNYRELRNSLEKSGHAFNTRSDTEVIINLYLSIS